MRPQRRLEILERDDFTCQQCRRSPIQQPGVMLAATHILPVTEGGETKPDNLQTLCTDCQRVEMEAERKNTVCSDKELSDVIIELLKASAHCLIIEANLHHST